MNDFIQLHRIILKTWNKKRRYHSISHKCTEIARKWIRCGKLVCTLSHSHTSWAGHHVWTDFMWHRWHYEINFECFRYVNTHLKLAGEFFDMLFYIKFKHKFMVVMLKTFDFSHVLLGSSHNCVLTLAFFFSTSWRQFNICFASIFTLLVTCYVLIGLTHVWIVTFYLNMVKISMNNTPFVDWTMSTAKIGFTYISFRFGLFLG